LNGIGIIILAAGASTRLGEPKQNLSFRGKNLLNHAITVAKETDYTPIIIITGAHTLETDDISDPEVYVVQNPDWQKGIAASISLGISYLQEKEPKISGVILMVCDQPYVTSTILHQLITERIKTNKPIIACSYQDTLGTPVLYDKKYFEALSNLKGDEGAKKIILKNLEEVASITFDLGSIDIDTEEDYQQLLDLDKS